MVNAGFLLFDPSSSLGSVITARASECIAIDLTLLGFSTVFGIFQQYYTTHDVLQGSKGDLATVGTTSTVSTCRCLNLHWI